MDSFTYTICSAVCYTIITLCRHPLHINASLFSHIIPSLHLHLHLHLHSFRVTVVEGPSTDPDARKEFEVYTMRCNNGTSRLRMSRSFGDFYLKQHEGLPADKQAVIAVPDVKIVERSSR